MALPFGFPGLCVGLVVAAIGSSVQLPGRRFWSRTPMEKSARSGRTIHLAAVLGGAFSRRDGHTDCQHGSARTDSTPSARRCCEAYPLGKQDASRRVDGLVGACLNLGRRDLLADSFKPPPATADNAIRRTEPKSGCGTSRSSVSTERLDPSDRPFLTQTGPTFGEHHA
jgi:hypothetical protein